MRRYLLLLSGLILLALSSCREQPEISNQLRTATVTSSPTPEIGVTLVTVASPLRGTEVKMIPETELTPTFTATPTPFIYMVAEGDTLFDIAAHHDTTTEAILQLNPGLQPELLSIGQELILPEQVRPDPKVTSNTPESLSIIISGLSLYQTPTNGIWIVGEVSNQGDQDLENVHVTVRLLDNAGHSVHETHLWTATNVVASGSKSPFATLVVPAPSIEVSPNAVIESATSIVDLGNRYLDFEVADAKITIKGAQATISGKIVNIGDKNASEVALIVTFYDDEGNVTGYHKSFMDESFSAGKSAPFEIHVLPPGGMVHDYALLAQGLADSNATPE